MLAINVQRKILTDIVKTLRREVYNELGLLLSEMEQS